MSSISRWASPCAGCKWGNDFRRVRAGRHDSFQQLLVHVSVEGFYAEPEVFAPARWLIDKQDGYGIEKDDVKRFTGDRRDLYHPFSLGPCNCPGQHLPWAVMRVMLAKLLWEFDMKLAPGVSLVELKDQKTFWHREHRNLEVEITRRLYG
ncbi:cytochrome P450 [Pleomassaria siparia CBS 279.74]|uniref:Cytochrome P450 n=1 Tax=Pleomassaria siparia CBS 279.74 TaxID=1314801 RepID=A0A6G1JU17_9PLEO|nr:cytochrome P450 [Pleomassaria siparia CBS 279.74]